MLYGNGSSTVLVRMFNESLTSFIGVIEITSSNNTIEKLYIDGDIDEIRQTFAGSQTNSIVGIILEKGAKNNTIVNNIICNNTSCGIYISDIESFNNIISENICRNNTYGIHLHNFCTNNIITGNICNDNGRGIYLQGSSSNNTIIGNICSNNEKGICLDSSSNNTITGNTCNNKIDYGFYGIYLKNSYNNVISGNSSYGNRERHEGTGIYLDSSSNNIISGNSCRNNDVYGIFLISSSNNAIVGNIFSCDNYGTGMPEISTYAGEVVVGSQRWGIKLSGKNNNDNLIAYNSIMGENYVTEGGTGNTFTGNKYN